MHRGFPRYSQYIDVRRKQWRARACGIVSLKMVADYFDAPSAPRNSIDFCINKGVRQGAYIPGIGWSHKGLVRLGAHLGLSGENYDWFKRSPRAAFALMLRFRHLPFLASVHAQFDPAREGHLIVVTHVGKSSISYMEPASPARRAIARRVSKNRFLKGWKRRIIVLYPKKIAPRRNEW